MVDSLISINKNENQLAIMQVNRIFDPIVLHSIAHGNNLQQNFVARKMVIKAHQQVHISKKNCLINVHDKLHCKTTAGSKEKHSSQQRSQENDLGMLLCYDNTISTESAENISGFPNVVMLPQSIHRR